MIRDEVTITVVETNDPVIRVKVWELDTSVDPPVRTPYDLTNNTDIEFYIKPGVSTPDSLATVRRRTSNNITIPPGGTTDGRFDVQLVSSNIPEGIGNQRYRVDVVKASGRETVMAGQLVVLNL